MTVSNWQYVKYLPVVSVKEVCTRAAVVSTIEDHQTIPRIKHMLPYPTALCCCKLNQRIIFFGSPWGVLYSVIGFSLLGSFDPGTTLCRGNKRATEKLLLCFKCNFWGSSGNLNEYSSGSSSIFFRGSEWVQTVLLIFPQGNYVILPFPRGLLSPQ